VKWRGIRRDSLDVSTDASQSLLSVNNRFAVDGELRLRRGIARTSVIKKDYAITEMSAFSAAQGITSMTLVDGDRWQGYTQPYSLWGDKPDYTVAPVGYEVAGLSMPEVSLGTLAVGSYTLSYLRGAVLWSSEPTRYAATRADIIQVVGLQVFVNGLWDWFSGFSDQDFTEAGAEALGAGKTYPLVIASPQEVKLRFYDGTPGDNSGSVFISIA